LIFDASLIQTLLNGVITGSIYFMVSIGLTLQYQLMKFPNLTHAELFTIGAFITYIFADIVGLGYWFSLPIGAVLTGGVAALIYLIVFKQLIKRGASLSHLIIAAAGMGILLRYALWEAAGRRSYFYSEFFTPYDIGSIRLSVLWIAIIIVAALTTLMLFLLFTKTMLGKAVRGLSSNPLLARVSGIDADKMTILVWFLSGVLAGLAGSLRAADTRLTPELGVEVLIPMFAVTVLGGIGSVSGAFMGAYILGLAESFGVVPLSSLGFPTEYKALTAFAALVITILILPTGLSSLLSKERTRRD